MRLRTLIGFGIGYALGARSDTDKFDNVNELVQSLASSPIVQALMQQAKNTAASGMQSLTGQQPSWGQAGNGQKAQQQAGQQQSAQQSEQGEEQAQESESEEEQQQEAETSNPNPQQSKSREGQQTKQPSS